MRGTCSQSHILNDIAPFNLLTRSETGPPIRSLLLYPHLEIDRPGSTKISGFVEDQHRHLLVVDRRWMASTTGIPSFHQSYSDHVSTSRISKMDPEAAGG